MADDDVTPTVEDVIADALRPVVEHRRHYGLDSEDADHFAAAVVAAVRAMTAEQQAELLDGEVESNWSDAIFGPMRSRIVGPWRTEP